MENLVATEKKLLREQMRARRRQLEPARQAAMSQAIISRLETLPIFQQARVIHAYVAWRNEVDTHDLIRRLLQERRRVAVPKVEPATDQLQHYFITDFSELQDGAFGILEPPPAPNRLAAPSQFDLVLVPGLAFDRAGNRLGMGKGHYDHFLAAVPSPKIALAYDFQLVEKLPVEAHDQRVNMIITEKNVILCPQHGNSTQP
jgi:5-formyltetrahydrofolate cyclo-ligase